MYPLGLERLSAGNMLAIFFKKVPMVGSDPVLYLLVLR
jgi:hypothetical protein